MKKTCLSLVISAFLLAAPQMAMAEKAPVGEYLDAQMGQNGIKVYLTKAKVVGDTLTMSIMYLKDTETLCDNLNAYKVSDVSLVAGGKRYQVLKDLSTNQWMAAPVWNNMITNNSGLTDKSQISEARMILCGSASFVAWFKFPAPPVGVDDVTFQVPGVTPFDVKITR